MKRSPLDARAAIDADSRPSNPVRVSRSRMAAPPGKPIGEEDMTTTVAPHPPSMQAPASTYEAAVVHGFNEPLTVEQVSARPLQGGQVRVKVEACGLCHTDIHAAHGDWPVKPAPPFTPGHESVGIVVELGPGVTEVALGDRVAM